MRNLFSLIFLFAITLFFSTTRAQTGWKWGVGSHESGGYPAYFDEAQSAIDPSGNVITIGWGEGDTLIFGPDTLLNFTGVPLVIVKTDTAGHVLWAKISQHAVSAWTSVVTDSSGNIYLAGSYGGDSMTLGGYTLINTAGYPNYMAFIAKYSPSGTVLWAKNIAEGQVYFSSLGIDGAQNLYVTGAFNFPSITIGSITLTDPGAPLLFTGYLAKYDALGNPIWAKGFGGPGSDWPSAMSVSANGAVCISGFFDSTSITFSSILLANSRNPSRNNFLASYDSSGTALWAKEITHVFPQQILAGTGGNTYLTGNIDSSVVLGPDTLIPYAFNDAVLAGFNSAGTFLWSRSAGGFGVDQAYGIALDKCGKLFIDGMTASGSMHFGSHVLTMTSGETAFIAEYDTTGNYIASWGLQNGGENDLCSIVVDKMGDFYFSGDIYNDVPYVVVGPDTVRQSGLESLLIAKYNYGLAGRSFTGAAVCRGATITLTDCCGGIWTSGATAIATIGSLSGMVTGVTTGTAAISYTTSFGCPDITTVTVEPLPSVITGNRSICLGATSAFTDSVTGGTWSCSNTNVTIGSTGVATGVALGTDTIIYTLATGCNRTVAVTVNPLPPAIMGTTVFCQGVTVTLTDGTTGGTWSGSNTNVIVGSAGTVKGASAGTATITYTLPTGCYTTKMVTVTASPGPIMGDLNVCVGDTTRLSDSTTGGTWITTSLITASISTTGLVTGMGAGTDLISYVVSPTCIATAVVTVSPAPAIITGPSTVLAGSFITLADATGGGTWSSSNPAIATVGSTGIVTGVVPGVVVISYTIGCSATKTITVNGCPAPITGTMSICVGGNTTLSDITTGGTWSSSSTAIATVGSLTGFVSGIAAGTCIITYTNGTCYSTATVTVNASPGISAGAGIAICSGSSATLTATGGTTYTWSPSTGLSATTGASVMATPTITTTYTVTGTTAGCNGAATKAVTVNALPTVSAGAGVIICPASSATLSATGATTYTWSPATGLSASTGASVVASPTVTTTYTVTGTTAGCNGTATKTVTIGSSLSISAGPDTAICAGSSATLAATGGTTYTWSPSTGLSATTGASVTAHPAATVTYTITGMSGGCTGTATKTISVNALPVISAGSSMAICSGSSATLTATGGTTYTWSPSTGLSATTGAIVTASPASTITYTIIGTAAGCNGAATKTVSVNATPGISAGPGVTICPGSSTTITATGGTTYTWSPSTGLSATTGATVVANPAATTTYTVTGTTAGCNGSATKTVNVGGSLIISAGPDTGICTGSSAMLTATGGTTYTWSPATGLSVTTGATVTAHPAATITYTITGHTAGCSGTATKTVSVNALPVISAGPGTGICTGSSATLTATGGTTYTWSPSTGLSATTGATVLASPATTITYTVTGTTTGCNGTATNTVTVNALPVISAGSGVTICSGSSTTMTATGGTTYTWSPPTGLSATTGATVGASPTATVTYTVTGTSGGCNGIATKTVTVNTIAGTITGSTVICQGTSTTLTDVYTGGMWTSSNTAIATIGSASGIVHGVSAGTVTITYTAPSGCKATQLMTIDPPPSAIVGPSSTMCLGHTLTLSDGTPGGGWSSSNTGVATVSTTGVVTGVGGGTAVISYTIGTGCAAIRTVTVMALPPMTGLHNLCAWGDTLTVHDSVTTGLYSSTLATVINLGGGAGSVTSYAAGVAHISYTLPSGCYVAATLTVYPIPGLITGPTHIAVGGTTTLTNSVTGGMWSSGAPAIATVGSATGVVTGVAAGAAHITYTLPTGCDADTIVHVAAARPSGTGHQAIAGDGSSITVIPNPNKGAFTISGTLGTTTQEDVWLELTDMLGQVVYKNKVTAQNGKIEEDISLGGLARGMYLLNVRWGEGDKVMHVVVNH